MLPGAALVTRVEVFSFAPKTVYKFSPVPDDMSDTEHREKSEEKVRHVTYVL